MKPVSIIGMGVFPQDLTSKHQELIKNAEILIGAKRHLEYFKDYSAQKKEISRDLKGTIEFIEKWKDRKSIVVLASGDPFTFDIGPLLIKALGRENVFIYPNISSIAPVAVIGMGVNEQDLTSRHMKLIENAEILIGAKRFLDIFAGKDCLTKELNKDIKGIVEYIKSWKDRKSIVVLASGDPLFFGIGQSLINNLGPGNVTIYPNVSTISLAFAKIKESWNDARIISIHGRFKTNELLNVFSREDKIAILTDPENDPARLASFLIEHQITDFNMCVFEKLGTPDEHVEWYDPNVAVSRKFLHPNVVILRRTSPRQDSAGKIYPGMSEKAYDHKKGLITKAEVRAVSIAKLKLNSTDYHVWDLGAGSGALGIEVSMFVPLGRVISVEKNPERISDIENNRKRFGVNNLEIVQASLPDCLKNLSSTKPDRIFIGGGGRDLCAIIKAAAAYLNPGGIMVVNTVIIKNVDTAMSAMQELDFDTRIVQVQVSRGKQMASGHRMEALNPVWIISGKKSNEEMI
ncbi:precorrin-6y C5,15-methyltransferase (decarboxylating) subunit CbiE [Desulfobacterales bacterium HSG16]|nr:precorrin-6y C5,15-methyltransferase (decarboxylating) subunit CbiE [Desulfobacterales bacterium HSG16]